METGTLAEFICTNREELLRRCRAKSAKRSAGLGVQPEMLGIRRFLDEVVSELSGGPSQIREMDAMATLHGADLFSSGCTVGQVVHDYGDVCQSVTGLAVELAASVGVDDFQTLNRCPDDSIASAVAEYSRQQRQGIEDDALEQSMQLRNLVETAINGFEAIQNGTVAVAGTTGALVHRSLLALRALCD